MFKQEKKSKRKNRSDKNGWISSNPSTTSVGMLNGVSDRARVKLRYASFADYASYTTVPSTQVLRGNGPFDPDVTSTGGQPNNYDLYASMYNFYRVYSATVRVWVGLDNTAYNVLGVLSARLTTTAAADSAGMDDRMASAYSTWRIINLAHEAREPHLQLKVDVSKLLGRPMTDPNLLSAVTTSPAIQFHFHVNTLATDRAAAVVSNINYDITYDVEFFDRIDSGIDARSERLALIKSWRKQKPSPTVPTSAEVKALDKPAVFRYVRVEVDPEAEASLGNTSAPTPSVAPAKPLARGYFS